MNGCQLADVLGTTGRAATAAAGRVGALNRSLSVTAFLATGFTARRLIYDIGFARCWSSGPVPLAFSNRPRVAIFGGAVDIGLAYLCAQRIQQYCLAAAVTHAQTSVAGVKRLETFGRQGRAGREDVTVGRGGSDLQRETAEVKSFVIRIVQFHKLISIVSARP